MPTYHPHGQLLTYLHTTNHGTEVSDAMHAVGMQGWNNQQDDRHWQTGKCTLQDGKAAATNQRGKTVREARKSVIKCLMNIRKKKLEEAKIATAET